MVNEMLMVTIISSSVIIASVIAGGFIRMSRSFGRLEGKVDGINNRLDGYNGQIAQLSNRIDTHLNLPRN